MATIAQVHSKVDEAVTAIEAADWSTAKSKLLAANAILAVLPSRSAKEGQEAEFDASAIDRLLALVNRELAASLGVQTSLVIYANADDTDEQY
jgi:hypothetical protein